MCLKTKMKKPHSSESSNYWGPKKDKRKIFSYDEHRHLCLATTQRFSPRQTLQNLTINDKKLDRKETELIPDVFVVKLFGNKLLACET